MLRPMLSVVVGSLLATSLFAQAPAAPKIDFPAASPTATFKQRVGLTDIEVEYSRPSVKGRKIFGDMLAYGSVWRTGANSATKITFSTAVKFGGVDVPAGTYALFSIPGQTEWTVILNKVPGQWGSYSYDAKNDIARTAVKPIALTTPVETFSIGLADLRDESATLYLTWEKTRVPVALGFDVTSSLVPQIEAVMASDEPKKPYFSAAMFYYDHNLDLKKASAWITTAAAQPGQFQFVMLYYKGVILAKVGDNAGALSAAQQSLELVANQSGELKDEYTRKNNAVIATVSAPTNTKVKVTVP